MSTFVLAFEYLDVNRPHILVVKSLYNKSYTCISVTYNECFMDIYKSENQEHFKKAE